MDSVGYKYLEHSTDAFVQVQGSTLEELFEKCAEGFVNIMFDIDKVKKRRSVAIGAEGDDLEGLLYDWLEKVLLKILIEHVVLSRFSVKICERPPFGEEKSYSLEARAEGEKVSYEKHNYKIEIKAITYHELKIRHLRNRYLATFLVDL